MTSSDVHFSLDVEDRFSALPDSLVLRILSLVPIRQVITKTSTLSKRFQHLWTHVPNLIFDQVTDQNHIQFVTQTLALRRHGSKIHHIFLDVGIEGDFSIFDQWLDLAAACNADALDLSLCCDIVDHLMLSLPEKLYTIPSLRKLKISYFSVDRIVGIVVGLISLNSLVIFDCECSGEAMSEILAGCPVLECLKMTFFHFKPIGRLILDSKSVRKLKFYGFGDQDALPVLCMPSLVDADLSFNIDYDQVQCLEIRKRFQQVLASLGSVENLKLTILPSCSVLSAEGLQAFPSQQLVNCKSLSLDAHVTKLEFPGMANLLQLVPNVEMLYLQFDYVQWQCKSCRFDGNNVELRERLSKCSLDHLKFVRIHISEAQFYAFDV